MVDIRLSPSRVEKWIECPARWGYSELAGELEPGTEATELGTLVHALREWYYRHGTPFDLATRGGWIANAMSPMLPRVLPPGGAVELELSYSANARVTLVGRLDLAYPAGDIAVVRDYKTTSSMQYAKLEREALFGHSQAPLYALMYMHALGVNGAMCGWAYVGTRTSLGPPPWPAPEIAASDHYITHAEATERVHMRMVPIAEAMLQARDAYAQGMPISDLPKDTTACYKYNRRCPHYAKCQPEKVNAATAAFRAAISNPTTPQIGPPHISFLAQVAAAQAAQTAPKAEPETFSQLAAQVINAPVVAPPAVPPVVIDATPVVNPPDGEGPAKPTKGKGKTQAAGVAARLDPADIEALAALVVQKLGLRLVRE